MKLLLLFILLPFVASAQLTYYIRSDSVKIEKTGGSNELFIKNSTRGINGILTNVGGGKTQFIGSRKVGDTLFVGKDTIIGIGGWSLTGNSGLDSVNNFLGTRDAVRLQFRVNNIRAGSLQATGRTFYGYGAGINDTNTASTNGFDYGATFIGYQAGFSHSPTNGSFSNTAVGYKALYSFAGGSGTHGNTAVGALSQQAATTGFRNSTVGLHTLYWNTTGSRNSAIGFAALERLQTGNDNVAVGESAARTSTTGSFNTMVGNSAGYFNTGSVTSITVNSSSSNWTTATVVIGPPNASAPGFTTEVQATATAVIVGNTIVSVTMTEIGVGYGPTIPAISFTGDGTSATATATVSAGSSNTAIGSTALYTNRTGFGNVGLGIQTGYGDATNVDDRRVRDSFMTHIGVYATARLANPQSVSLRESTSIGYKSIVSQSYSLVLGQAGVTKVGIGTTAPAYRFDVTGASRFSDTLRANGPILANNTTDIIPAINSLLDQGEVKIGHRSGADAGLSIYRAQSSNFGGASINTYRTNSNDLSTKASVVSVQSLYQMVNYGVAGDNSTVQASSIQRVRANGTPLSTSIPSFYDIELTDLTGVRGPAFRVYPEGSIFGNNVLTAANVSAQLEVTSTVRGFLPPRMTTTQQNAIATPASGLLVYNTDSLKFAFYNGTSWIFIGSAAGGGGSGVTTMSAIGSTPNANGATIAGTTLNLEPASGSFGGVTTTGTQTFAGAKTFSTSLTSPLISATTNAVIGSTATPNGTSPLTIDAASTNTAPMWAFGKNGNPVYFRGDANGNITDIGGGTARIFSSGGKPYFPDGFVSSSWASYQDGNVSLIGLASTVPWAIDGSASTVNNQVGFLVRGNNAATKGDLMQWQRNDATVLARIDKDGNFTAANIAGTTVTPTATIISNVDAVTPFALHYSRNGTTVSYSGTIDIDITVAVGSAVVELSLPVSSNFTSTTDASGVATPTNVGVFGGYITGSIANDRLVLTVSAVGTGVVTYTLTGSYTIK